MRKKALVINPWVMDFKLYDEWMHPCGLYFLIDLLWRNSYDVQFFNCLRRDDRKQKQNGTGDFLFEEISKPFVYNSIKRKFKRYGVSTQELTDYLLSTIKPDVVFVGSSMTYWALGLAATIRVVSGIFPDVPCIVGGTAAHLISDWIRSIPGVTDVFTGSLFSAVDLEHSGIPAMADFRPLSSEASMVSAFTGLETMNHAPVITSFGCPMRCSYCASGILCKKYSRRPVKIVVEELALCASKFGLSNAAFYDDALLLDAESHFIPFAEKIREMGLSMLFHTPNGLHVKFMTKQLIDLMMEIGVKTLRFGYESGKKTDFSHTGGKTSFEQLAQKVTLMESSGFSGAAIGVYIMAGLPDQTPEMVMQEMDSVASLGVLVKPVFLSPVPHTPLFATYAKQYPQILSDPLTHNDSYFVTMLPNWDNTAMQQILDRAKLHNVKTTSLTR